MDKQMKAKRFEAGQKVRFDGRTNVINDRIYAGQVGTVDFQCTDFTFVDGEQVDIPGLVYVHIKAPGQRKPRCISLHPDSLVAA